MNEQNSVKELAGRSFESGYNCAEAVMRAFKEKLNLDLSDDALKISSAFGGGAGAGCMCGALSAAIMVIGLLQGRTNKEQDRTVVRASAGAFHRIFTEKFGAACCRALHKYPLGTKEQSGNCLIITEETADLLAKYFQDKQIVKL